MRILRCGNKDFLRLAEALLKRGECVKFRAEGMSMSPAIRSGDSIKIEPVTGNITLGEIVLYRDKDGFVIVHRVVEKIQKGDKEFLLTKGDSALTLDAPIANEQIIGKVTDIERNRLRIRHILGKAWQWLQNQRSYSIFAKILLRPKSVVIILKEKTSENNGVLSWEAGRGKSIIGQVELDLSSAEPDLSYRDGKDCPSGQDLSIKEEKVCPSGQENPDSARGGVISSLWVDYKYRKLGLGERLIREVLVYASKSGLKYLRLYVSPLQSPALKLYKKLGFEVITANNQNPAFKGFIYLMKNVQGPVGNTS